MGTGPSGFDWFSINCSNPGEKLHNAHCHRSFSGLIWGRHHTLMNRLSIIFPNLVMANATLPPNLAKIVERFQRHTDPKKRYEQLLWYGKKLEPMAEEGKIPANKVQGCVSQVYITADLEDGKVIYQGDSDAQLVKGLVALLIQGLNGLTPTEIVELTPDFIEATGLQVSLTPSRANGFYNIFKLMQTKAIAFQLGQSYGES